MKRILAVSALVFCATFLTACSDSGPRNNGPTGPTFPFAGLDVRENDTTGASIVNGSAAVGDLDFGTTDVGNPITRTFAVVNEGTADLTLDTFTVVGTNPGDFTVDTTNTTSPLAPGENTTFQITFNPTTTGTREAQVRFTHNSAAVFSPFLFNLGGVGQNVAAQNP